MDWLPSHCAGQGYARLALYETYQLACVNDAAGSTTRSPPEDWAGALTTYCSPTEPPAMIPSGGTTTTGLLGSRQLGGGGLNDHLYHVWPVNARV